MRTLLTCLLSTLLLLLASCSQLNQSRKDGPPLMAVNTQHIPNAKPHRITKSRYGNPPSYVVMGKRYYVLKTARGYNKRGIASWYGTKFHGKLTSSREPYNMYAMTAASPTLPIPCFVRVTNLTNGKQIVVKVNDRGPFAPNRIIDLSYVAAKKIGMIKNGTALVQVTALNISPPMLASNSSQHLYLQLGAFSQLGNAHKLRVQASKITSKPIIIEKALRNFSPIYRVQVGPIDTVAQSDQLQQRFTHRGFGHAITVIH